MSSLRAVLATVGWNLIRHAAGVWSVFVILVVLAAAGAALVVAPLQPTLSSAADPVFTPEAFDQDWLYDMTWRDTASQRFNGTLWGFCGLAVLGLLVWGDAVLIQAAAGPWPGVAAAWSFAWRRSRALLTVTLATLLWMLLASTVANGLAARAAEGFAARQESERLAIWLGSTADLGVLLLLVPAWVIAAVSRVMAVLEPNLSGFQSLRRGARAVVTNAAPWVIWSSVLAAELFWVWLFAASRAWWDPRLASSVSFSLVVILTILLGRTVLHAGMLGALAEWVRVRGFSLGASRVPYDAELTTELQRNALAPTTLGGDENR
jgi:hypothetical protein